MKIVIIGLAQVGKKTLFSLLTTSHKPSEKEIISNKPIKVICIFVEKMLERLEQKIKQTSEGCTPGSCAIGNDGSCLDKS